MAKSVAVEQLMSSQDLAETLGISPRTVETWRNTGEGPDYVKIGTQVRYRPGDVDEWLTSIRRIQGNTAGREKPGPGWRDFVSRALISSDTSVLKDDVWTAWQEYLSAEGDIRDSGPEQLADLRHALSPYLTVSGSNADLTGIRFTAYGRDLVTQPRQRETRGLPNQIPATDVARLPVSGEQFVLGLKAGRNGRPDPFVIDFAESPLLAVLGDHSGKTTLIRRLVREVIARRTGPEESTVIIFDPNRALTSETDFLAGDDDYYECDPEPMALRIEQLAQILQNRFPPPHLGWKAKRDWRFEGPLVYLFVDDLHMLPKHVQLTRDNNASGAPHRERRELWAPLTPFVEKAQRIGLRILVTYPAQLSIGFLDASEPFSTITKRGEAANRIMLGSPHGTQLRAHGITRRFEHDVPPGLGYLLASRGEDCGYHQLALPRES